MNHRPRRFSSTIAIGLSIIVALVLIVLVQNIPNRIPTQQADQPVAQVIEATQSDSPLPTPFTPIVIIEPTWTPFPTVPPPPTPTSLSGPTPTPMFLTELASDAAGSVLYALLDEQNELSISSIYSISVDGKGESISDATQLLNDPNISALHMYPSPDGSRIVFEGGWGINYVVYMNNFKVEPVFRDISNPMGQFFNWHPDSRHILVGTLQGDTDIGLWLVDTDTGKHVTLSAEYPAPYDTAGVVSPDGQKVVYARKQDFQTPAELWMTDVNGSEHHKLYTFNGNIASLVWSPDGSRLAFWGDGLMVMEADTVNPKTVAKEVVVDYGFQPVWSPDGQKLAFVAAEQSSISSPPNKKDMTLAGQRMQAFSGTNIHLVDVDTGEERPLITDGSTGNIDPVWSPDSLQIAFASFHDGIGAIMLVNADGTNVRQLVNANQPIRFPYWQKK